MNKQKFIDLLRNPKDATEEYLADLESVVNQFPYFQSAHIVLAKGSKELKDPKTPKRISLAAMYSTDRLLLKKYINGQLVFLDTEKPVPGAVPSTINEQTVTPASKKKEETSSPQEPPQTKREQGSVPNGSKPHIKKTVTSAPQKAESRNKIPPLDLKKSDFDADSVIDEIKSELVEFKKNRKIFDDYIEGEEERNAVEEALKKAKASQEEQERLAQEEEEKIETANKLAQEEQEKIVQQQQGEVKLKAEKEEQDRIEENKIIEAEEEKNKVSDELTQSLQKEEATHSEKSDVQTENNESITEEAQKQVEEPNVVSHKPENEPAITKEKTESIVKKPMPEPKPSGYASKILIEGSNKPAGGNTKDEEDQVEKKARKRTVTKVKKAPEMTSNVSGETGEKNEDTSIDSSSIQSNDIQNKVTEETKSETSITPHEEDTEDEANSQKTTDTEDILESIVEELEEVKNKAATETTTETESTIVDSPKTDDQETAEFGTEETKTEIQEKPEIAASQVNQSEEVSTVENTESVDTNETESEKIESQEKEDSTTNQDNTNVESETDSGNLEVNDESGFIHRESENFDIKKDKKLAGKLRKEKLQMLREQRGIIDEFIETDPQMPAPTVKKAPSPEVEPSKPDEEVLNDPADLAAGSQKPKEGIVSENLAIIYKNQGKPKKAIDIYHKLILKFPEKEAYFAARIEELNK